MINGWARGLVAAMLLCAAPFGAGAQQVAQQAGAGAAPAELMVRATGRVEVVPDMATLSLGVTREAETAEAAVDAMSAAGRDVLAALDAAGIGERDVQTSGLSLRPDWRHDDGTRNAPPKIVGYIAATDVTVRVRDLDALGSVLDAVVGEGANTFRGLSFGVQAPDPVQDAARIAAVKEAQRRAALLAEAAGVTLGAILSLSEEGGSGRPMPVMRAEMAMADSGGVPVAEGEVSFTATVLMRFAIAP